MANRLNPAARHDNKDIIIVPPTPKPSAPPHDHPYVRTDELETLVNAIIDGRKTEFKPHTFYQLIIGNDWATVPTSWSTSGTTAWSMAGPGRLFVVASADLIDRSTVAGDPEIRLQLLSGPTESFSQTDGFIGASTNDGTVTGTVSITAEMTITGAGTVAIQAQRRSSSTNNTDLQIRNYVLRAIYVPDVTGIV